MSPKPRVLAAGAPCPHSSRFPALSRVVPLGLAALVFTGTAAMAVVPVKGVLESSGSQEMQWQSAYLMSEPAPDSKVVSQVAKGTSIVIHPERSTDQYFCVDIASPSGTVQGFVWKQFVHTDGAPAPAAATPPQPEPPPGRVSKAPLASTSDLRLQMMPAQALPPEAEAAAADIIQAPKRSGKKPKKDPGDEGDAVAQTAGPAVLQGPIKELRKLRSKLETELENLPQGKMDKAAMAQMDRLVTCLNDVLEMERATTKAFEGTSVVMSNHQKSINELQEKVARLSASSGGSERVSGDLGGQVSQLRKTVLDMSVRVADSRSQGAKIKGLEQKLARLERLVQKLEGEPAVQVVARADPNQVVTEVEPEPTPAPKKRRKHAKKKVQPEEDDEPEEPRAQPARPSPTRDVGLTNSQGTGATNVADIAVGEMREKPSPAPVETASAPAIQPLPAKPLSQTQIQSRLANLLKIVRTHQVKGSEEKPSEALAKVPNDMQDDPTPPKVAASSDNGGQKVAQRPPPRSPAKPADVDDDDATPEPKPAIAAKGTPKEKMSINQIERIMNARLD
jgi:hypothetical protein